MKIDGVGNLCLWCMEEMGNSPCCPYCGHDAREPMRAEQSIPAGSIIGGHYLVGRTLGQGGFGITYLAYDLDLHIKRAIKEYFPQGLAMRVGNTVQVTRQSVAEIYQKGVDSFYREAQSIARFGGHPNVVQVHAFFRENNTAYFVMDYVEGISFQQYLNDRGGRVSWEEALRILKPIGEALTALHESRLLHRDVKPDNIFITRNGTPKLLDFGAARYETSETTHSSAAVLTPGYAPVEQYGSMSRQGTYTDVYALSATFYRAVSGVVPIPAPDRMEEDPLLPLDKVDGRVSARVGAALSHGMVVRSEKRTQSVAELLNELESPSSRKSASKLPKWLLPAAVAAALALGLVLGMGLRKPGAVEKQTEPAAETVDLAGTAEALALTKVKESEIPTNTPEPTADRTLEAIAVQKTSFAETEAAWNMKPGTEAAPPTAAIEPTATNKPTATPTAVPTNTPEPTADRTLEAIAIQKTSFAETEAAWHVRMETEAAPPTAAIEPTATNKPTATPTAVPTNTPEPTADRTLEAIAIQKTSFAEAARPMETPTATAPAEVVPEVSISGLTAAVSGNKACLSWDALPGAESYQVVYSLSSSASGVTHSRTTRDTSFETQLTAGNTYYFKVRAKLADGKYSGYSTMVSAVSLEPTAVPAADNAAAVPVVDKITDDIQFEKSVYLISVDGSFWYRQPDVSSDQLGWLKAGTEIQLTGENKSGDGKQWTKIKTAKDVEGWIDSENYTTMGASINAAEAQPGDYLYYGHYEQDNDTENGAESIKWRILAREENSLLLLSEYGLDAKPYNATSGSITWEECTLRSWLNGEFYESAFSAEEQAQIAETEVKAEKNPKYSTNPGNDTKDKIFLLSIGEANTYFEDNEDRQCKVTTYAKANNAYSNSDYTGWWWLRSPGNSSNIAASVLTGGSVNYGGSGVDNYHGVARPALWLNL